MYDCVHFLGGRVAILNIAKGTTDPRIEFISQVPTQILIKFHLANLQQTVVNTFLIINMGNSNNLNKFELSSLHAA